MPRQSSKNIISAEQLMKMIELLVKKEEVEQLKKRVDFLEHDLPRVKDRYERLEKMIKEAEEDHSWMQGRLEELERENKKLKDLLASKKG